MVRFSSILQAKVSQTGDYRTIHSRFFCHKAKLVIEIDGSQHFDQQIIMKDNSRTEYFNSLGLQVLRVDNGEVNRNFEGVCEGIMLLKRCGSETTVEIKD